MFNVLRQLYTALWRPCPLQSKSPPRCQQTAAKKVWRNGYSVLSWIRATLKFSSQGRVDFINSFFGDADKRVRTVFFFNQDI